MSDADPGLELGQIVGLAGGIFLAILIISVAIHFIRSKQARASSRLARQPQRQPQTTMRPVVISDAQPPHPPQPPWHRPQTVRPYQAPLPRPYQPQNPYQTSIPEPHYPTQVNTEEQHNHNSFYPDLTTPPNTYHPTFHVQDHHVLHTYTQHTQQYSHPHPHEQSTQPQPRFSSDDLLSFEATGDDKESPCPICLGPLEEEPVSTGQCLHLMHTSCLRNWLSKDARSACPVCRLPFSDDLNTHHHPIPTAPPPPSAIHNSAGPT